MRWLSRWLLRVLVAFAIVTIVVFALDWTVYLLRGAPQSTVIVNQFLTVPLKGQKTEFDFLGTANVPCAIAMFPHGGMTPCWYLQTHPNEWDHAGSPAW